MEAIGLYLLKSAAWLTGFALVYLLVLRNERYFRLNRFYLLTGIVASLLFPFYTFRYIVVIPSVPTEFASVGELVAGGVVAAEPAVPFYYWIYLAGIVAFFLRVLFQTWKILRKLQEAGFERTGNVKLVRTPDYSASFSFFSYVFVNPSTSAHEMEEIMNHEQEHIRQRHWFDLLLVELICIVQWFNPFAWVYAHLVRQNHEYLADESALQRTIDPAVYQAALLNQLLGAPVFSLTNSFSYSLNKKRFKMMKKKIDSPFRKLKVLVVLPLAAMLFYAFALPEYQYETIETTVAVDDNKVEVKGQVVKSDGTPLAGTSVILRNSTIGTITDQEGNFLLKDMPADGELFFSFVGFKTVVKKITAQPMTITMEVGKVGIEGVTVVGYGTPPPPLPPPPPIAQIKSNIDEANPPLIYLDGVLIDKKAMDQLNPSQIFSISVLKDQSATAVYGEKAKNGVILITTKEKAGKSTGEKSGNEEMVVVGYGKKTVGQKPSSSTVAIRSIDDANPPLIYLDGIPITKAAMDQLDPEIFKSISVLKDKSATDIYGEKAKNGVILITSKGNSLNSKEIANRKLFVLDGVPSDPNTFEITDISKYVTVNKLDSESATKLYGEKGKNGAFILVSKDKFIDSQLILLDGKVISKSEMDQLGPDRIASMDILKGKSATDRYGEKAKNGVILITSKENAGSNANATVNQNSDKKPETKEVSTIGSDPANPPLYFVNNVLADPKEIGQIKPDMIDHVDVLKEQTATATYGEKGKNGAIFIYTKTKQDGIVETKVNRPRADGVFVVVEEMPEFPGKELALREFIAKTVKYPADALKDSIQGKVYVTFVVKSDGSIGDSKVARGVHPSLDKEAIRVVNQFPTWKPGKQGGKAVDVSYTVPILFALQGKNVNQTVSFTPPKDHQKAGKEVFVVVEEMPEFPGGSQALRSFVAKSIRYPADAQKEKIQGKVYVSFVVSSTGKVENAKIERSVSPALDAEAIRVVSQMPDWKPGMQRGKAVSVEYTIPIEFKLQ